MTVLTLITHLVVLPVVCTLWKFEQKMVRSSEIK
jgi:hypothetical protein